MTTPTPSKTDIDRLKASGVLDAEWYRRTYTDVDELKMDPAEHYLKYGKIMGRMKNALTQYTDPNDQLRESANLIDQKFFNAAFNMIGDPAHFTEKSNHLELALRSLICLRRFDEAHTIMQKAREKNTPLHSSIARKIEMAHQYLNAKEIKTEYKGDSTLSVIKHIADELGSEPLREFHAVKKRIVITTNSLAIGGAERQVMSTATGLARQQDVESVTILINKSREHTFKISGIEKKISLRFVDKTIKMKNDNYKHTFDVENLSKLFGLSSISHYYYELMKLRPEVVHIRSGQHIEIALAALLAGVPKIIVHFGSMTRKHQSISNDASLLREGLLEKGLAYLYKKTQIKLYANSRSAANDWADAMQLPRSKLGVIRNCVNFCEITNIKTSHQQNKNKKLVVGVIFRFAPVKNPLMWVRVAREILYLKPNTEFIMVGGGPMYSSVQKEIESCGLKKYFTLPGMVTSDLPAWLHKMDVFLMTSITESLPNAIIEAQANGIPVVAPDVGGISEALASSTSGRVCELSIEALARTVIEYLNDEKLRQKIKNETPKLIKSKFSSKRQIKTIRAAYEW